jgi:uncharacterized oxidoreductase
VITGGTSGIGYALTKQLHSNNDVIVIARNSSKLTALKRDFSGIIAYTADLSVAGDIEAVADAIVKQFDSIDILINNAAVQYTPSFLDDDFRYETIAYQVALNFTGVCALTYLLLSALLHQKKALIVNVNSGLGLAPKTSSAIYCATKGALNTFSRSLGYQLETTNAAVQQVFLELVDTIMTSGRGNNKMPADAAASNIIYGIQQDISEHDIGKVKLLRLLLRLAPSIAQRIMKKY